RLVLDDGTAQVDITVSADGLDAGRGHLEFLDPGDIVGIVLGPGAPLTGRSVTILSKGLRARPTPEGWRASPTRFLKHEVGLADDAARREVIKLRSRIISYVRRYLESKGFIEVETPLLVPQRVMAPVHDYMLSRPRIEPGGSLRTTNTDYMRRLVA